MEDTTQNTGTPQTPDNVALAGRPLRTWLRTAGALISRERAIGRSDVRDRIAAAVPADDLETTVRTLEAIARELGSDADIEALRRGPGKHRHGFGPRREHGFGHPGHGFPLGGPDGFGPHGHDHDRHRHGGRGERGACEHDHGDRGRGFGPHGRRWA
ncbi:hypothetical protein [Microbacterium marinilacus]|uniref:Uncharacterized protein n=1 Tax=Microbacterium marinilacus TaxID=415209 RepID=A0ABP7BT56_9MICO|nr:hypothetical protein [Microbacterium marinilacus]MBY0689257.1 hypothetical protein [Microbacterium marinilacus]